MTSITYRITGLMFLAVALTVFLLVYLANTQMTDLFQEYLVVQNLEMHRNMMGQMEAGGQMATVTMGTPEHNFLTSVHQSLIWVGAGILLVGLAASFALARSITVPLRKLGTAAAEIEQGNFAQKVPVESKDEVGNLAMIFNRMAETLDTNNRLRRQFLANIAHELRTPLAVIQGHLEGMIDGIIEANHNQLSSLHEESVRLSRLIKDLRDLSLAEVRQLTLEKSDIDVNQVVSRVVYMLKPLADERNVVVGCELSPVLPPIVADSDRISQVFYNIIVNAIRYSPQGGSIKLMTALHESAGQAWLKVAVADEGPGIDPADVPHIFDHFYRSDKSRDRKSGGSGLGLAIVKQLVEIHGGRVFVESKLGAGSTFYVLFPTKLQQHSTISPSP